MEVWRMRLNAIVRGFADELESSIRSAVLLGLIGLVVYPILPQRLPCPWVVVACVPKTSITKRYPRRGSENSGCQRGRNTFPDAIRRTRFRCIAIPRRDIACMRLLGAEPVDENGSGIYIPEAISWFPNVKSCDSELPRVRATRESYSQDVAKRARAAPSIYPCAPLSSRTILFTKDFASPKSISVLSR